MNIGASWSIVLYSRKARYLFNVWKSLNVLHHIDKLKSKNDMTMWCRKAFDKIQRPFIWKSFQKNRIRGEFLNLISEIFENLSVSIYLITKDWMLSIYTQEQYKNIPSYHSYYLILEVLSSAVRQENERKSVQILKEEEEKIPVCR